MTICHIIPCVWYMHTFYVYAKKIWKILCKNLFKCLASCEVYIMGLSIFKVSILLPQQRPMTLVSR